MQLSKLSEMESCFLFILSETDIASIRREPFELECGEILEPFDTFTEIGSNSSAGNQPIKVTAPWVQRYQGKLLAKPENFEWLASNWHNRDFVLFDAFNSEDPSEDFVSCGYRYKWEGTKGTKEGYYIAYLIQSGNRMFHTRGSTSSSVCKGTSITRWKPDR